MSLDGAAIAKLWDAFKTFDSDGSGVISTTELKAVMLSLGLSPSDAELRDLINDVDIDRSGAIDFDEFKALMIFQLGDHRSRLELAFGVFDENGDGLIGLDDMRAVMGKHGMTDQELQELISEVDSDGDGCIDVEEFSKLLPEAPAKIETLTTTAAPPVETTADGRQAAVLPEAKPPAASIETAAAQVVAAAVAAMAQGDGDTELARLKALLAQHPQSEKKRGTSRLQMQIGLFRFLQGAAYRSFRENFSLHHETHLRVRDLPYRLPDFVNIVKAAIALYKGLGLVEEACHPVLDAVVESVAQAHAQLQERIEHWATLPRTPEMLAEAQAMSERRYKSTAVRDKFAASVEFAITMRKKKLRLGDVVEGVLALNELNRLRQMELQAENDAPPPSPEGDPAEYLKKWNRVILVDASEHTDGAMMPVAYWYEDFMPKLLAAFSVCTAADIEENTVPDETALNEWYDSVKAKGEFQRYGDDIAQGFLACAPRQKLMLKQAWRLTHHYLNGVQKRRERLETGRESGALSQYISFIDVYVGRSYVANSQMRVSFPYFIGPPVWRFFHTAAEIVCTKPPEEQAVLASRFRDFFKLFATMYPCPYCRHHLNAYVVQNREVSMYPIEYLVLGYYPSRPGFIVSMDDKLATVVDGPSMRMFLWKLHNTVSSSIARSEAWYQKDERAFYTTRHWPSLDSELARSQALKHISISRDRIYSIYSILKPAARLAGLSAELQRLLDKGDRQAILDAYPVAELYIRQLEEAVLQGRFLQETYRFDAELVEDAPFFTPEEEEFARSNVFVDGI
jgi:Ca2+-binding EF-hand superfamily protein